MTQLLDSTWYVKGDPNLNTVLKTAEDIPGYVRAYPVNQEASIGKEAKVVIRIKKISKTDLRTYREKIQKIPNVTDVECHSNEHSSS